MTTYTIELTESEELAMQYIALSANAWIQHAIHERARIATEQIVQDVLPKFFENNVQIPASKAEIVIEAYDRGYIKSAAQTNAELLAKMQTVNNTSNTANN
jgi:hypothetical protein